MQITICDICGTRKDVQKVWFPYDRKMDAAGSMENVGETFDLCCKCYLKVLKSVILKEAEIGRINEWTFNKELIEDIRNRINIKKK